MSTVLWANCLANGVVTSDEGDKYALYKYLGKLDGLCKSIGVAELSGFCDSTDIECNVGDKELPEGMASTDALMAQQGTWIDASEAIVILQALLDTVRQRKTRFGLLRNDHDAVVAELQESIVFAKAAAAKGAKFNFAIVM
jgi:hypothetical protein